MIFRLWCELATGSLATLAPLLQCSFQREFPDLPTDLEAEVRLQRPAPGRLSPPLGPRPAAPKSP